MAKLITYTCPVCHVTRTLWSDQRRVTGRPNCCPAAKLRRPKKQPLPADVTEPRLYALAALADNLGVRKCE